MLTLRLEFCILPNWVYIGLKAKRTSGIRNAIHHMVTWLGKKSLITVLACCAGLAGCGGGSGNSSPAVGNPDPISPNPPSGPGTTGNALNFPASDLYKDSCGAPRISTAQESFPDLLGRFEDEAYWLRSWSYETYLWYDEINYGDPEDIAPSAQGVADYFETLVTLETTPAGNAKDRFHYARDTAEYEAASQQGISFGYGASFRLISARPPRELVISLVEPSSPAAIAGLRRGTRILAVDGEDLINGTDVDTLNSGLFPRQNGEQHSFSVLDRGALQPRTVTMTSAQIREDPVPIARTIVTDSGNVGYLLFNRHILTAEQKLVDAVRSFRDQNITDLVVDLRYNGGGYLYIANQLAYMIAGSGVAGQTFGSLEFNSKNPGTNPITGQALQPTAFRTTTVEAQPSGALLPTLNLPSSRVFVLTTGSTCSASEALINGLRGVGVEVIQIGTTTCGKPYGFYPQDNCGTTYFTTQFRSVNALGFGDYPDGFSPANSTETSFGVALPGCQAAEDYSPLGSDEDPFLSAALRYREDPSICPEPAQAAGNAAGSSSVTDTATDRAGGTALRLLSPTLQDALIRPIEG